MKPELPRHPLGFMNEPYSLHNLPPDIPEYETYVAANELNKHLFARMTGKQRMFLEEYMVSQFDAAAAAVYAGYAEKTDTRAQQRKIGNKIAQQQYIQTGIKLCMNYYSERSKVRVESLVTELAAIALSNMADFFYAGEDDAPYLRMPEEDDPRYRMKMAAVSEMQTETYMEGRGDAAERVKKTRIKLHPKQAAIDKLLNLANMTKQAAGTAAKTAATDASEGAKQVTQINILGVAQGEFLPAPEKHAVMITDSADFSGGNS